MDCIPKRKRASGPKVRTGCTTCKIRRVKCDETKPKCQRCTRTGRVCDGYALQLRPLNLVIEPSLSTTATSKTEQRALEFFYQKTSPQLAGFFSRSFWKGCALQLSLAEPCIRHAIAAVGALHEGQVLRNDGYEEAMSSALTLYNDAIHAAVRRPALDTSGSLPVLIVASIIFTCFEFLRENPNAALAHIKSGISLVKDSRNGEGGSHKPWGQSYHSFEKAFLETELAPILATLYLTTSNHDRSRSNIGVLLNPVDDDGSINFGKSFDTVHQARTGLVDLLCSTLDLARLVDQRETDPGGINKHLERVKGAHTQWKALFNDMVIRHSDTWSKEESRAVDHVHIMWYSIKTGFTASFVDNETAWDLHKTDFEEILRLAGPLVSNPRQSSSEPQRELSSEVGFLASVYVVAWKCRWPYLRRQALDLISKASESECTPNSRIYHAIFTRIMEMEEAVYGLPTDSMISQDLLPPECARVYQYYGSPCATGDGQRYEITFLTRPNWPDRECHYYKETLDLGTAWENAEMNSSRPTLPPQLGSMQSYGATTRMLTIINSAASRSLP